MKNKILIWMLVLFCLVGSSFAFSNVSVVAHWSNDDAYTNGALSIDSHTGLYNGTITSATSGVAGILGEAYEYDGSDDKVVIGDNAVWNFDSVTINQWIKSTESADYQSLWHQRGGNNHRVELRWLGSTNKLGAALYDGSTSTATYCDFGATNVDDGNWHMITWYKNGANMTIYIDANLCISSVGNAVSIDPNIDVTIGLDSSDADYWAGTMDEVTFFSEALHQQNITDLYNSGVGLAYPFTPPVAAANFTITATRRYYGDTLNIFNATINNATGYQWNYTTTTGQINTTIDPSNSMIANITLVAPEHTDRIYLGYDTSSALAANLTYLKTKINVTAITSPTGTKVENFTITFDSLNRTHNFDYTTGANGTAIGWGYWNDTYNLTIDAPDYEISSATTWANETTNYHQFLLRATNTLNITFRRESDETIISDRNVTLEAIGDYYANNYSTETGLMSINISIPSTYTLRYTAAGFHENFYFFNLVNRTFNTLNLYLSNQSTNANVTAIVYDQANNLVEDATIKMKKYYIASNSYILVEEAKTNFLGKSTLHPILNSEYYKFTIEVEDVSVYESTPTYIYNTDDLIFTISIGDSPFADFFESQGIDYTLSFNDATDNVRFNWNDPDGTIYGGCLYVYTLGKAKTLLDSTCTQSAASTILINIAGTNGTYYLADAYIQTDSSNQDFVDSISIDNWIIDIITSDVALFMVVILTIAFFFIGRFNIALASILMPLPLFVSSLLGLVPIDKSFGLAFFILGVIIAFAVTKK